MSSDVSDTPEILTRVGELMAAYPRPWLLCGGWAVDAWLGRQTRDHLDVDIAVFQDDLQVLFEYLAGWHVVGHDPHVPDDTKELWNGRHLDLPGHIHANTAAMNGIELDIQVNERAGADWVLGPGLTTPLVTDATAAWRLPTVAPEVILFYKSGMGPEPSRDRDEQDFHALAASLTAAQRSWLRKALPGAHPWQERLTG